MPIEKRKIWALVMNSTHARILRDLGTGGREPEANSAAELEFRIDAKQLGDVMTDRPGRSFASFGGGRRSAMEYGSDPLAEETRNLIREVIAALEKHQRRGAFRELAIYAEASVLGELRKMLPQPLRALVCKETSANYLQTPPQELSQTLAEDLGLMGPR
ncbi:MAG: host attachment protein [Pararhodobacter sp.]